MDINSTVGRAFFTGATTAVVSSITGSYPNTAAKRALKESLSLTGPREHLLGAGTSRSIPSLKRMHVEFRKSDKTVKHISKKITIC
jgi:hypothetical protein